MKRGGDVGAFTHCSAPRADSCFEWGPRERRATATKPSERNETLLSAEAEGRRALARLRRAVEKSERELDAVRGALRHAEGDDFPAEAFGDAAAHMRALLEFIDEQSARLEEKILTAGGLEPGRVRRTGGASP